MRLFFHNIETFFLVGHDLLNENFRNFVIIDLLCQIRKIIGRITAFLSLDRIVDCTKFVLLVLRLFSHCRAINLHFNHRLLPILLLLILTCLRVNDATLGKGFPFTFNFIVCHTDALNRLFLGALREVNT